jgi:hypothetical protein
VYKFLINHKKLQETSEALEDTGAMMKNVAAIDAIPSAEYPLHKRVAACFGGCQLHKPYPITPIYFSAAWYGQMIENPRRDNFTCAFLDAFMFARVTWRVL